MDRPTAREAIPVEGNPHQGHRRRMLDKFGRLGVDAFADHELLEVLLYYTIRQGDTNPVAHALMQHFGSLCVAYVDSSCRLIRCDDQSRGSTSKVLLDPVAIPRSAVMCNAAGVVLAHNHPNGEARPSREDISATQMLVARLAPLDIALVDHCIVAQDSYYSMARGGELQLMMRGHRG